MVKKKKKTKREKGKEKKEVSNHLQMQADRSVLDFLNPLTIQSRVGGPAPKNQPGVCQRC